MDRAEQLRGKRDSYTVPLMEFYKAYPKTPELLFCFFEGEDEKYYCSRINIIIPNSDYGKIECGSKDNVIHLYEVITKQ